MMCSRDDAVFTCIWKIENCGYCLQKNTEHLFSPEFKISALDNTSWRLILYPRGFRDASFVSLFLQRMKSSSSRRHQPLLDSPEMDFTLAIHTNNGTLLATRRYGNQSFRVFDVVGDDKFLKRNGEGWLRLLDDTILVCCQILKRKVFLAFDYEQFGIRTRVAIERKSFTLAIDKVGSLLPNQRRSLSLYFKLISNPLRFDIVLSEGIKMDIVRSTSDAAMFSKFKITVTDHSGLVNEVLEFEHLFQLAEKVCHSPTLMRDKKLAKTKEVLQLHCECTISVGVVSNRIENSSQGVQTNTVTETTPEIAQEPDLPSYDSLFPSGNQTSKGIQTVFDDQQTSSTIDHSLLKDLQFAYRNKILCDFKLQSGEVVYPVHKMILGARSSVFRAMFESDTKEGASGQVEIHDVDSDTLRLLLLFFYEDEIEQLQWECASKLYFAADKYKVLSLKEKCSNVLKKELRVSNACEVLVLADTHQDSELKRAVQDFILAHDKEILRSESWDIFEAKNVRLAVETMKHIYLKKLCD